MFAEVFIYFRLLVVLVGVSASFRKFFSKKFVLNIVGPLLVCIPGLWMAIRSEHYATSIVICK